MNRLALTLGVVSLLGCGSARPRASQPRTGAARAAVTTGANDVSCSSPAARVFGAGLCVCENASLVGSGLTAMSSDGLTTDVGVDGLTHVVGDYRIDGTLVSWKGIDDVGTLQTRDDVMTPASVTGVGTLTVGRDLIVGGDLSTVGEITVGGLVRAAGKVTHVGNGLAQTGPYLPRESPPCGCDPSQLLDVAGEVTKVAERNDNDSIGLSKVNQVGALTLELKGGRYYLESVDSVGDLELHVTAPSALYIGGNLKTVGTDTIDVDEGASLDLYVAGNVENVGTWRVGQGTLAGVVRMFVGGKDPLLASVGDKDFVGAIYAPTADFTLVGNTSIRGGLFVKNLTGTGELLVDFARAATPAPGACP